MGDLETKMIELEQLCPGVHFDRTITNNLLILHAASPNGGIHRYQVDLTELGIFVEQWFDDELAKRPQSPHDLAYNILCNQCGRVQMGRINYIEQMGLPDSRWICPLCGSFAEFDDDAYHDYWRNQEDKEYTHMNSDE